VDLVLAQVQAAQMGEMGDQAGAREELQQARELRERQLQDKAQMAALKQVVKMAAQVVAVQQL
jgi:hypothetical protein